MSALTNWEVEVEGHYLDLDGAPVQHRAQCHDVWLSYLISVVGGTIADGHAPEDVDPNGPTSEVWRQFPHHRPALAKLFTKHYGAGGIRAGDVVFWGVGASNHPASHVVVATSAVDDFGLFWCVSQNPGPATVTQLSAHQVAGYLRPIKDPTEEPMTEAEMNKVADLVVKKLMRHRIKQTGGFRGTRVTYEALLARQSSQFGIIKSRTQKIARKIGLKL